MMKLSISSVRLDFFEFGVNCLSIRLRKWQLSFLIEGFLLCTQSREDRIVNKLSGVFYSLPVLMLASRSCSDRHST